MVSRRQFLSSGAALVSTVVAGCAARSGSAPRIDRILVSNRRREPHEIHLLVLDADGDPATWRAFEFGPRNGSETGSPSGAVLRDLPELSDGWTVHAQLTGGDSVASLSSGDIENADCVKVDVLVPREEVRDSAELDIIRASC